MINAIILQSTAKLIDKLTTYSNWSGSHACELNLDKTDIWLKIIEGYKPNIKPNTIIPFNFHSFLYFGCQNSPMLQCLGFKIEAGQFFNKSDLQRKIFKKYTNFGRTKENYLSLQFDLINADLFEASFFDTTYIDKIDKIFNFVNYGF